MGEMRKNYSPKETILLWWKGSAEKATRWNG